MGRRTVEKTENRPNIRGFFCPKRPENVLCDGKAEECAEAPFLRLVLL